jgi:hypothetical protein
VWKLVGNFVERKALELQAAGGRDDFSHLQLQQQDSVLYVPIALLKTNLSLVVMMSAVDLWKGLHLSRSMALARKGKSAEV